MLPMFSTLRWRSSPISPWSMRSILDKHSVQSPQRRQESSKKERGSSLPSMPPRPWPSLPTPVESGAQPFSMSGVHTIGGFIGLLGRHQVINAVAALAAIRLLRTAGATISENSIRKGLRRAQWPGRLQLFPGRPLVILDGAHNPAGAIALRAFLEEQRFAGRVTLVFGVLQDKNWIAMLRELGPLAKRVVLTRPESERAADPHRLPEAERFCPKIEILEDVAEAIALAKAVTEPEDAVVVTGSLFVISAALRALGEQQART